MADTALKLPAFAVRLTQEVDEKRTEALEAHHADYDANVEHWQLMIDAFEGAGGFSTGEYLWPYRNERNEDYVKRQKTARYHNHVEAVIDLYTQQVFTREPSRQTDNDDLREWWTDVDGHGTSMTDFMRQTVSLALASGHCGVLVDQTTDQPVGPSKADQKARPFLTRYLAPSITDWRNMGAEVTAVKLCEAVPMGSIVDIAPVGDASMQFLLWDEEGWARFDYEGALIAGSITGLGLVPFDVVRPKPSLARPFMGRSLFSNGQIVRALFNRMSEEDQVLRDQAFSILAIEVPHDGDVEQAKKQIGEQIGTTIALVVQGKSGYISPDMKIPNEIRENQLRIIREMYRQAHMRFENDSLQGETAEAIQLKYKELNEMLLGIAAELQRVEDQLTRFFFAWTSPSPEAAEAAYEAANVTIGYPDEFFVADLATDLTAWAQAIAMDLGETMTGRIKKKAVRRLEPELQPEEAAVIDKEIDAQPKQQQAALAGAADQIRAGVQARLGQKPQQPPAVKPNGAQ